MHKTEIPATLVARLQAGVVIPAHPLALDRERRIDERRQRALTRYYIDAGAGGIAVGVHTTQFEIHDAQTGLLRPVLELAAETARDWCGRRQGEVLLVAGVCGGTGQAVREAELACALGYHAVLLSLAALPDATVPELVQHCRRVAEAMPLIGFYLQPAAGGRLLPYAFWRAFAEIENVAAVKIAPFNRYQTLDVLRGVVDSGRGDSIALYTGNDDTIVADLLTPFAIRTDAGVRTVRIAGGLLGHWAVWTRKAVTLLEEVHAAIARGGDIPAELLGRGAAVTDANGAFFDAANGFAGCIPGIHEVLRRQGLLEGIVCLNPEDVLSPGQAEEIDRVCRAYPELNDDAFVLEHRDEWLGE